MKHLQKAVVKKRGFQMIFNTSGLSGKHSFGLDILLDFSDFRVQPYKIPQIHYSKTRFSQIGKMLRFFSHFTAMNYQWYACSKAVHFLLSNSIGGSFSHCLL